MEDGFLFLKYTTDYSTRSQVVDEHIKDIYNCFVNNDTVSDLTVIHELWLRLLLLLMVFECEF